MGEKKGKNTVFYVSLIIVGIIAVWSVAFNDSFTVVANAAFKVLTTDFGWLYLISMIIFFGFIVYFAFGKYGKIRLGSDDSRPEYSNITWFGLLFGCGMGVGLVSVSYTHLDVYKRQVCKQRRGGSTCIGGRQADRMPFGNCKTW